MINNKILGCFDIDSFPFQLEKEDQITICLGSPGSKFIDVLKISKKKDIEKILKVLAEVETK